MDHHQILGVAKTASKADIKRAFRALALKVHPDKNKDKDASEDFKRVAEAYYALMDDDAKSNSSDSTFTTTFYQEGRNWKKTLKEEQQRQIHRQRRGQNEAKMEKVLAKASKKGRGFVVGTEAPNDAGEKWKVEPQYEVKQLIGTGSYGSVCEAFDTSKRCLVAVKRIGHMFEDLVDCKRILREIAILSKLKRNKESSTANGVAKTRN